MNYTHFPNGVRTGRGLLTEEGGFATLFPNETGSTLVHGTAVAVDPAHPGGVRAQASEYDVIGIAYGDIEDGEEGWVVTGGVAEVLLKDGTAGIAGYWCKGADTDGRAEATTPPDGLGAINTTEHFKEIGHCLDTKDAGTNVLVRIALHTL